MIERSLNAAPETVFEAISTLEGLKQWMGPGDCHVLSGDVDFKVDGNYRLEMQTDDGPVTVAGTYLEISPPQKLSYTWRWLGENEAAFKDSVVTIALAPADAGTILTLTHVGLPSAEAQEHHEMGWNGCFDKLQSTVS